MVEVVFITNGAARHTIVYTCINFAQVLLNFVCENTRALHVIMWHNVRMRNVVLVSIWN